MAGFFYIAYPCLAPLTLFTERCVALEGVDLCRGSTAPVLSASACLRMPGINGAAARIAAAVHVDRRTAEGHAAGVDFDESAAALEGQFAAGFEHHFQAAAEVNFLACFDELAGADFDVLVHADCQVVVGAGFNFAVFVTFLVGTPYTSSFVPCSKFCI